MRIHLFIPVLLCLIFFMTACAPKEPTIELEGKYRGKNIMVQNPYGPGNVGFCVMEVKVNGKIAADEVNSEAFEIDLSIYNLKEGDDVEIELVHKKGCEPRVMNADVLN